MQAYFFTAPYLDGNLASDRLAVWTERLHDPGSDQCTIVAVHDDGAVVGFAHTIPEDDPTWGAFLENLHVAYMIKRPGVGTWLLAARALAVRERTPTSGIYL